MTDKPVKLSFYEAAKNLALVCQQIEEGEELDESLTAIFGVSLNDLAESIDRRKAFHAEVQSKIAMAKAYKKEIDAHLKRYEKIQGRLKELTKQVMQDNEGLAFRDSFGKKLFLIKTKALKCDLELNSKAFSNILDPAYIDFLGIDHKYYSQVTFFTLNTDELKRDLESGAQLPWARLEQRTSLRGL